MHNGSAHAHNPFSVLWKACKRSGKNGTADRPEPLVALVNRSTQRSASSSPLGTPAAFKAALTADRG